MQKAGVSVMLFYSFLHRSSCFSDMDRIRKVSFKQLYLVCLGEQNLEVGLAEIAVVLC